MTLSELIAKLQALNNALGRHDDPTVELGTRNPADSVYFMHSVEGVQLEGSRLLILGNPWTYERQSDGPAHSMWP